MKCISCEIEINPKWKHAIDQNICPFCGRSIMEELLKGLLSTLQDTMEKLQTYSTQVDDWLLSNYGYIKTDSPDLKNYVPKEILKEMKREHDQEDFEKKKSIIKVKTEHGEEEVVTEKIQSDSKTVGFFERAQVVKRGADNSDSDDDDGKETVALGKKPKVKTTFRTPAEKTEYIKGLKKKIETEGSQAVVNEAGLATMISPEMLENADPEEVAEMESMLAGGDIISSGLPPMSGGDDEDAMAERVLAMNQIAAAKSKGHSGGYNEQDMRSLLEMQQRRQKSRQAFENGENRGGKGGGFSRS